MPSPKAAMNDAEYILLKRKKRLWPAKILSRIHASRTRRAQKDAALSTYCLVEILGLNEQASVHCKDVERLTEESIECIAAKLGQSGKGQDNVEEITYRRALREALDILKQAAPSKERSPSKTMRNKAATWKETEECAAGRWRRSSRNDTQKRGGDIGEASTAPQIVDAPNKRSCCSRGKVKGSSSAKSLRSLSRVPLKNGELKGRPQQAPKVKTSVTPKKDVTLKWSSRPGVSRRSPRLSEGCERHRHDEAGRERNPPSSPSKWSSRTSTPARSSHNCAKSGENPGGKLGLRRSPRGSPVKGPSAEAEKGLSEKEEFPPRKYSKDLQGGRHPQDSKGPGQKQPPLVSSLCWERKCASRRKGSTGSLDREGPVLDGVREESLDPCADEAENIQLCDPAGKADLGSPCEPALRLSPIRELCLSSAFGDEEEVEDEEELPSILLHQEPYSMEVGMLVWCKLPRNPYWPAVVKSVKRKAKKASVQLIEKRMGEKKSKGHIFSLRKLKHFDCEEKQMLIDKARKSYQDEINWCINLIADYRIRVGCQSFTGTFWEYFADDMSSWVRKETRHNLSPMIFPEIEEVDSEEPPSETTPPKPPSETTPPKKVLPDRTRAARDKANRKIVEFIVNDKGADEHLQAILKSKKESRWLKMFLEAPPCVTSIETYLEDDDQQDLVVGYLRKLDWEVDAELLPLINGNDIKFTKFILDVLFPEAIIYAISAVDRMDYKKAEEKYIRGPLLSQREKEIFEEGILEKKRKQRLQRPTHSPEELL